MAASVGFASAPQASSSKRKRGICCSTSRERFFKESNLSAEERVRLYTIDAEGDPDTAASLALKHAAALPIFLDKRPVVYFNQDAFNVAEQFRQKHSIESKIVIDAGCGTGLSTQMIAQENPDSLVIGVDRSLARISKQKREQQDNVLFLRADLVDFWRLAHQSQWKVEKQFLLYPNPYPKSSDMKKRWHGHPCFPLLLQLGGVLEIRANWRGYLEEFAASVRALIEHPQASSLIGLSSADVEIEQIHQTDSTQSISLFERKYHLSGVPTYKLVVQLGRSRF